VTWKWLFQVLQVIRPISSKLLPASNLQIGTQYVRIEWICGHSSASSRLDVDYSVVVFLLRVHMHANAIFQSEPESRRVQRGDCVPPCFFCRV